MRQYLILNSDGYPMAEANLISPVDQEVLLFELPEEKEGWFHPQDQIQLVGAEESSPDFLGTVERCRGNRVNVRPNVPLDARVRKNLRVVSHFQGLLYPISGNWKGQRMVHGEDLSCGGVAFYCNQVLNVDETAELVLPVTTQPLIVPIKVLRIEQQKDAPTRYAARFIDLIHDQEAMIRKAVFEIQIASAR